MSSRPRSRGSRRMTADFAVLGRHASRRERRFRRAPRCSRARAVLRQPALRDVEAGENLDARDQRLRQRLRGAAYGAQQAVDAHAHDQPAADRLDMDVAGPQVDRLFEEIVEARTTGAPLARSRRLSMLSSSRALERPRRLREVFRVRAGRCGQRAWRRPRTRRRRCRPARPARSPARLQRRDVAGVGDREAERRPRSDQQKERPRLRAGSAGETRRQRPPDIRSGSVIRGSCKQAATSSAKSWAEISLASQNCAKASRRASAGT